MEGGIAMTLKKIIGTAAIAGALGLSAIGLAGVASAAPAPQVAPGVVQHVQLDDWHGGRGGWRGGDRDDGGGGWRGGDRDGGGGDRDGGAWHGGDRDGGWGGWRGGDRDGGWGGPGW
jgi:hypothetical protein